MPLEVTLAYVRHDPVDCPLEQEEPTDALTLSNGLEKVNPDGIFWRKRHQGVVITLKTPHETLLEVLHKAMPKHHEPVIRTVTVDDDSEIALTLAQPERIDESNTADPERIRHIDALCAEFAVFYPDADLLPHEPDEPRTSLHDLIGYLKEHAPGIASEA